MTEETNMQKNHMEFHIWMEMGKVCNGDLGKIPKAVCVWWLISSARVLQKQDSKDFDSEWTDLRLLIWLDVCDYQFSR